jgi:hypothetical protein
MKKQEETMENIVYYGRSGERKNKTGLSAHHKDGLIAYKSYNTIVAFCDTKGNVFERKGFLTNTTSKHKCYLNRYAYHDKAVMLPIDAFWEQMQKAGVLSVFDYHGTNYDHPPFDLKQ